MDEDLLRFTRDILLDAALAVRYGTRTIPDGGPRMKLVLSPSPS